MAAFRAATDAGAGIECDVRLSSDGEPVVFVPVESERDGRSSIDEARVVVQIVRSLMRDSRVPPEAIGVVSPFRAQVVLLRQLLADTGITIDTVERFQGGDADPDRDADPDSDRHTDSDGDRDADAHAGSDVDARRARLPHDGRRFRRLRGEPGPR